MLVVDKKHDKSRGEAGGEAGNKVYLIEHSNLVPRPLQEL